MRLAVLFDNLGPYHVARLNALAARTDVVALQVRTQSVDYGWQTPELPRGLIVRTLLSNPSGHPTWAAIADALERGLSGDRIEALAIPGWSSAPALCAAVWASNAGIPTIVMSDSNAWDVRRTYTAERIKAHVVRMFAAGLCAGEPQRTYLASLGMRREAIFLGYDVVDNDYFATRAEQARASGVLPALSVDRTLPGEWVGRYFLASGRMMAMKNQPVLLEAYAAYRRLAAQPWPLVILGDGPLRGDLERQKTRLGLDDWVFMPGFKQYPELPAYYGTAGAFVHVSRLEPWGLVVNEAMASGLPVIVSTRCGSASTLVRHGENGFLVEAAMPDTITEAMQRMAAADGARRMGVASREIIADWGVDRFASGLCAAADCARAHAVSHPPVGGAALCRVVSKLNEWRVDRTER